jgi:hypothetical protein
MNNEFITHKIKKRKGKYKVLDFRGDQDEIQNYLHAAVTSTKLLRVSRKFLIKFTSAIAIPLSLDTKYKVVQI